MNPAKPKYLYRLPPEFVERHRATIEAIDWTNKQVATLALGWPVDPALELIVRHGQQIVRPASIGSANAIRKSVGNPLVDPVVIAAILADRNPKPENAE